jgi:ClpP class serine protease
MGIYSEYIDRLFDWRTLENERKKQLSRISQLRGGRAVLTFASAMTKQDDIAIDYSDRVPIIDQISNLKGDKIDIILETPGGYAEVVEDIIKYIRNRFSEVTRYNQVYTK